VGLGGGATMPSESSLCTSLGDDARRLSRNCARWARPVGVRRRRAPLRRRRGRGPGGEGRRGAGRAVRLLVDVVARVALELRAVDGEHALKPVGLHRALLAARRAGVSARAAPRRDPAGAGGGTRCLDEEEKERRSAWEARKVERRLRRS